MCLPHRGMCALKERPLCSLLAVDVRGAGAFLGAGCEARSCKVP